MNQNLSTTTWALRGVVIGLAAGLVELALVVVPVLVPATHGSGMFHVSPHWLWLKPLTVAAFGASIGMFGAFAQRFRLRLAIPRVVYWAITTGVLLSVAFTYRKSIWNVSLALIAAGAAVPASLLLVRREGMFRGRAIWVAAASAVASLVAAGVFVEVRPGVLEARLKAGLGPAPTGAPNIVLVVLDTVRAPALAPSDRSLGAWPSVARLAADGVEFTQAIATSSWTLESHASLFTGWYPHQVFTTGETPINFQTPFPRDVPTLAEAMVRRGYVTGGFAANTNYASREHGLDRGFLHYDDYPLTWGDVVASSSLGLAAIERVRTWQRRPKPVGQRNAAQVTEAFLNWFDQQAGRPVFAFLNYFDAHDPYVPDAGFRTKPLIANPMVNPYHRYAGEELADLKLAYDDSVRYLDHIVGRLVAALEQRQALESTILVITSDHGEHFGEHDLMSHGNSLYRPVLQVPLVIRYPASIPAGSRVSAPVSLRDVPATLLEMTGASGETLPGVSLARLWKEPSSDHAVSPIVSSVVVGRDPHGFAPANWPVSRGSMRSVVAEGLHYVLNGDGVEELYDWKADVAEGRNLARSPDHALALQRLRTILKTVEDRGR